MQRDEFGRLDVSVITAAYALERWSLTCAAVDSVLAQTFVPREIVIPVDHNPELFRRLRKQWAGHGATNGGTKITVVESRYKGHLGASATTGVEVATSGYVVFLDDDASAAPDWLERMVSPFKDPSVIAVGGAPLPVYARPRPRWLPEAFDWVFGCAYAGLPTTAGPILHLIGTTMAVRRKDLVAIGGIYSDDHGDLEMSHRLLEHAPGSQLIYEPNAIVHHFVPGSRLTWGYFWRRCFFANQRKVVTMRSLGSAGNLAAERRYVMRTLSLAVLRGLGQFLRGDLGGLLRASAICVGLGLSTTGYAIGTVQWYLTGRRRLTRMTHASSVEDVSGSTPQ